MSREYFVKERRQQPERRRASKKLFGSQYRVEVAAVISKIEGVWTTSDLEKKLPDRDDLPWSCVAKELASLVQLGLIERAPQDSIDGRLPYMKTDKLTEFWDLVRAIYDESTDSSQLHILPGA